MMKRLIISVVLFIGMFVNGWTAPDIQLVTSPKGIKAWFIPESKLDIISITFSWCGGSAYESPNKNGLTSLLADMLLEGTQKMSGPDLKDFLLENAIQIDFNASDDRIGGSLRLTMSDMPKFFPLFKEILRTPRFDKNDLQRLQRQYLTYLQNLYKNPSVQAMLRHNKRIVGNHPYALNSNGNPKTIMNVTVADLQQQWQWILARDSLVIGVCGRITVDELGILLDQLFADLPAKNSLPPLATPQMTFNNNIEYVSSKNPQANVLFSQPGLAHTNADFMKLYLINYIIGGDASSRLWRSLRDQHGLVYGVSTQLTFNEKATTLSGALGADNAKVMQAIDLVRNIWQDISMNGITQSELDNAKTYLIGAFPMNFSSTSSIAHAMHGYQVYGLNIDYFKNRTAIINAVTLNDINAFAKRFIDKKQLMITVAGQQPTNPNIQVNKLVKGTIN